MSSDPASTTLSPESAAAARAPVQRSGRSKKRSTLHAHGEPMVWLTGGALGLALFMIVGLLLLVVWQGVFTFWPGELLKVTTPVKEM